MLEKAGCSRCPVLFYIGHQGKRAGRRAAKARWRPERPPSGERRNRRKSKLVT